MGKPGLSASHRHPAQNKLKPVNSKAGHNGKSDENRSGMQPWFRGMSKTKSGESHNSPRVGKSKTMARSNRGNQTRQGNAHLTNNTAPTEGELQGGDATNRSVTPQANRRETGGTPNAEATAANLTVSEYVQQQQANGSMLSAETAKKHITDMVRNKIFPRMKFHQEAAGGLDCGGRM